MLEPEHGDAEHWLEELCDLPDEAVYVHHVPPTPRYARAARSLRHILRAGVVLGTQADLERPGAILVAVWAPATSRRSRGYYACFRVRTREGRPASAVLYCFYDGRDGSPALGSPETARMFASQHGFDVE